MTDATPFPLPRQTRQTDVLSGNGGTVYGPFGFKIFDIEDVEVWTRAADEVRFSRAAATVAKVSGLAFDAFTVAFAAALPVTTEFVVRSARVAERSAGVKSGTRLDPDALEKEFSKISTTDQELRRDLGRAVLSDFGALPYTLSDDLADGDTIMKLGQRLVKGANAADIANAQQHAADAEAASVEAMAAAAAAVGAANSQFRFVSHALFLAAAIPLVVTAVSVSGWFGADAGGASERVRVAEPGTVMPWHIQKPDGSWWKIVENDAITPLHFGAEAVSGTAVTGQFAAMVAYSKEFGVRMKLPGGGRVYEKAGRTLIHDNFDLEIEAGAMLRRTGIDSYLFVNTDGTRPGGYDGCRGFRLHGHNRINSIIDLNSAGPTTTSAMVFAHQDGWLVENVCIKGGYQSHYAEINSSRGVRFINCSFPDHAFTAGAGNFETLQIDYSNPVGYPENGPYDNTPCTDVMIIGCYFGPGQSAIGTHSTPAGDLHSNIHIIGCTFDAQAAYTIRAQGWMHSEIVGNVIRNSGNRGILSYDCKHIAIERNWIVGGCANDGATTGYGIAIGTNGGVDPIGVSVKGNRIIGVLAVGIYAASGTRHDVSDNYLEDSGEEAISIGSTVTRPTIAGNRIFGASVSVSGAKVAVRIAASSGKIHSNVIKRSDAANTYGYGIYFPTGAMRNTCDNNDVQSGINGAIGDQSASTSLNAINGRTLLFSGSAISGTITLADLITSFSALEVQTGAVGSGTFSSGRAVPFAAASGWVVATDHVTVNTISGKVDCTIASTAQLTVVTANDAVRAIYGLAA
ncbi:MAG: hypothetical protein DI589_06560 [Shinella sp.]|nr:MAG: hypothetical protein DI589_06560 [Shinella sp.]